MDTLRDRWLMTRKRMQTGRKCGISWNIQDSIQGPQWQQWMYEFEGLRSIPMAAWCPMIYIEKKGTTRCPVSHTGIEAELKRTSTAGVWRRITEACQTSPQLQTTPAWHLDSPPVWHRSERPIDWHWSHGLPHPSAAVLPWLLRRCRREKQIHKRCLSVFKVRQQIGRGRLVPFRQDRVVD